MKGTVALLMMAGVTMGVQLKDELQDDGMRVEYYIDKGMLTEQKPTYADRRSADCLDSSDTKRCKETKKKPKANSSADD